MPDATTPSQDVKRKAAREVIDILHEIAMLLNTHLDRQQLSYCVSLIENGAHPEALAQVIRTLRAEPETDDGGGGALPAGTGQNRTRRQDGGT